MAGDSPIFEVDLYVSDLDFFCLVHLDHLSYDGVDNARLAQLVMFLLGERDLSCPAVSLVDIPAFAGVGEIDLTDSELARYEILPLHQFHPLHPQ
jgi:hypothetical protein